MTTKAITINITEETEGLIRKCTRALYGEETQQEDLGELLTVFLPDLISDALNGETMVGTLCSNLEHTVEPEAEPSMSTEEIRKQIEAVSSQVENPDISMPLELNDTEQRDEGELELKPPELNDILNSPDGQQVNNSAVVWAKGNPAKEAALAETLWALPSSLWSMARVRDLAERTYNMRASSPDA